MQTGVHLCLATSMDGRIAEASGAAPNFTSRYDRHKLFRLRAGADVLLVGANTVRQEQLAPLVRDPEAAARRRENGQPPHPAVVIVSRSLNLPWRSRYFTEAQQPLFVLTDRVSDEVRRATAEVAVTFLEAGDADLFRFGIGALQERGFGLILAEGGGTLVHALLERDLVDRFYLTVAPVVLGGGDTPLLVNGPRLETPAHFTLHTCEQVASELHLEYRRLEAAD